MGQWPGGQRTETTVNSAEQFEIPASTSIFEQNSVHCFPVPVSLSVSLQKHLFCQVSVTLTTQSTINSELTGRSHTDMHVVTHRTKTGLFFLTQFQDLVDLTVCGSYLL